LTSAFYNVANDPAASDPKKHQAELGYTLFGFGEGMVDIDTELKRIVQSVEEEGATLATFWEVQQVVNLLRDAHVIAPSTNAGLLSQGYIAFIPDRSADGKIKARSSFSNDAVTKELKLKIHWVDEDGKESESTVETINGARPYDFFLNVSNSTSISDLEYQSYGARFNRLLMLIKGFGDALEKEAYGRNVTAILGVGVNGRPSDVYPSEVQVKYEDGDEETYRSFLVLPNLAFENFLLYRSEDALYNVNETKMQAVINLPGSVYSQDKKAEDAIMSSLDRRARSLDVEVDAMNGTNFWGYQYPEDDPKPKVALKAMDEYAILKVENFHLVSDDVLQVWPRLVGLAKEGGIKKLIVDLSNNGGGLINGGTTLSQLMYPSVGEEVFSKDFAAVINEPMQIFRDELEPLYENLNEFFSSKNENEVEEIFQNITDGFTDDVVRAVNATIGALPTYCASDVDNCEQLVETLQGQWASFVTNRTASQCFYLADTMLTVIRSTDRLVSIAYDQAENGEANFEDFMEGFKTVNQGGVLTNITNRITFYSSSYYNKTLELATQVDADFDEYIILSNGVGGSTTAIFASKVEQIWKNRDKSLVDTKLTTVTYGGLQGGDGDGNVTVAGFPANNKQINPEMQYIQYLVAFLFNRLFVNWLAEGDAETFGEFESALGHFLESVANTTPYFSDTKAGFPVSQYYSNYMGPGALPLQYINMPADEHIPFHYLDTKIQDYGDLEALYKQTAEFFSSPSVDPSEKGADTSGAVAQSYLFGLWLANVALYAILSL
jgi:hypothetical protein